MNVIEFFEDELPLLGVSLAYPAPIAIPIGGEEIAVSADTDEHQIVHTSDCTTLYIQASHHESHAGQLTLTNRGGGLLSGRIQAGAGLEFSANQFQKNQITLNYTLTASEQTQEHTAMVLTNGGAHKLVFVSELIPRRLIIQGQKLQNLKDFYEFSQDNATLAKSVFLKQEFGYWLSAIGYAHVGIYEQLRQDTNRERGFDNFLVFNQLKPATQITLTSDQQSFTINPYNNADYHGTLTLTMDSPGYIDQALVASAPFIKLERDRVTTSDFKHTGELSVGYSIDKNLLTDTLSEATISLTDCEGQVQVLAQKLPPISIELSPNYCAIKDPVVLTLTNNTSKPIKVDIATSDSFVKVDAPSYTVSDTLEVPVHIRLSKLMQARKTMKKQHLFGAVIKVTAHLRDKRIYKDIQLTVGDF